MKDFLCGLNRSTIMQDKWNERYKSEEFIYGLEPNEFFAKMLEPKLRGKLLLPGEGEGRNAIYAASIGWDVHAFDQSDVAAAKAMIYARLNKFTFEYEINDCANFDMVENYYDAVGLIYLHLEPKLRKAFHQKLARNIKAGGIIIGEFFSSNQIMFDSGGPKDPELLYDVETIRDDFSELAHIKVEEKMITLHEGLLHNGTASVIRLIGMKGC